MQVVEEVVGMPAEDGLHLIALQQGQEPGAGRLTHIVIVLHLRGVVEEQGMVHAPEHPPARSPVSLQIVQHPGALLGLQGQADAAAVDKGEAIVGFGGPYAGEAPDAGAYETGASLPIYGPRDQR